MTITLASTESQIVDCFPVMAELRPHLSEDEFVPRVQKQRRDGYQLAFLEQDGAVQAVAGFRFLENLAWGRLLYVDDLVTRGAARSRGYGDGLFDWLLAFARDNGCGPLHLDSGVQRFGAHRFYLRRRMDITSHHFALILD